MIDPQKWGQEQRVPAVAPESTTIDMVRAEVQRSRGKYPGNRDMLQALRGEVAELAEALARGNRIDVEAEARQVAAVAIRIFEEGDASSENALDMPPLGVVEDRTPAQLYADGDWRPTPGARVVTAERLTAHIYGVWGQDRKPGKAGTVRLMVDGHGQRWMVRHDDGTDAPYDADELRPGPAADPKPKETVRARLRRIDDENRGG